mmetsp:Transcript_23504/g.66492  ORF Transcript_23504/g.66492 Transcript_23504/m.66492 type:complete len:345 (+) Transcript_23504:883-1917(+)
MEPTPSATPIACSVTKCASSHCPDNFPRQVAPDHSFGGTASRVGVPPKLVLPPLMTLASSSVEVMCLQKEVLQSEIELHWRTNEGSFLPILLFWMTDDSCASPKSPNVQLAMRRSSGRWPLCPGNGRFLPSSHSTGPALLRITNFQDSSGSVYFNHALPDHLGKAELNELRTTPRRGSQAPSSSELPTTTSSSPGAVRAQTTSHITRQPSMVGGLSACASASGCSPNAVANTARPLVGKNNVLFGPVSQRATPLSATMTNLNCSTFEPSPNAAARLPRVHAGYEVGDAESASPSSGRQFPRASPSPTKRTCSPKAVSARTPIVTIGSAWLSICCQCPSILPLGG